MHGVDVVASNDDDGQVKNDVARFKGGTGIMRDPRYHQRGETVMTLNPDKENKIDN